LLLTGKPLFFCAVAADERVVDPLERPLQTLPLQIHDHLLMKDRADGLSVSDQIE
jgi:hypothetical protein